MRKHRVHERRPGGPADGSSRSGSTGRTDSPHDQDADIYHGVDLGNARRFAAAGWLIALAAGIGFAPFFPPTRQVAGVSGWLLAGLGIAVLLIPTLVTFARGARGSTLWLTSFAGCALVGWIAWLAGPRAPYHHLLLLVVVATALVQPPRRLAAVLAAVIAVRFEPLVFDRAGFRPGDAAMQSLLWIGLAAFLHALIVQLRAQRAQLTRYGEQAEAAALLDQLTGLGNRRAFDAHLARELERTRRSGDTFCVAVIDLDDLKSINDGFGHPAGDRALREVASQLDAGSRAIDGCYRWGGDEFAILLPGADRAAAVQALERLQAVVAASAGRPDGSPLRLSYGVAEFHPALDGEALVAAADGDLLVRRGLDRR